MQVAFFNDSCPNEYLWLFCNDCSTLMAGNHSAHIFVHTSPFPEFLSEIRGASQELQLSAFLKTPVDDICL